MSIINTGDGSPTLFSVHYDESFHSTFGAATESRYVFLECSGVQARLEAGLPTKVLEIGLGLGLNTLLSFDLAVNCRASLEYHAIENDPTICQLAQQVDYRPLLSHPELAESLKKILGSRTSATASKQAIQHSPANTFEDCHRFEIAADQKVYVHWENAVLSALPEREFDAIYLDAFSPDNNPECWTTEFFCKLLHCLKPQGKLSTYCAKGVVRRSLKAAGFDVQKLPGPPGKREIMVATRL